MASESTRDTFGTSARDSIAKQYANDLIEHPAQYRELIHEMIRDGYEGMRDMKDTEVFRIGMMMGFFDEDVGEDR